MFDQNELTHDQKRQVADWKRIINTYEGKGQEKFSYIEIQQLLTQIQDFLKGGLPDRLYLNIKKVTDAIFETSLILAEPEKYDKHQKIASQLLYSAIKELCQE